MIKLKVQNIVLKAFDKLNGNVGLAVVGDGVERTNLLKLTKELGISGRVKSFSYHRRETMVDGH